MSRSTSAATSSVIADEQRVAIVFAQLAVVHRAVEHDLDVHLVVGGVDARTVVDRVGVDAAAGERVLDPAVLGEAEVAALANAAAAQLAAVDPHRVVRLVADGRVRLGARFHVGADPAVVEQVDGCLQDRADQLGRRERVDAVGDPEPGAHLRA